MERGQASPPRPPARPCSPSCWDDSETPNGQDAREVVCGVRLGKNPNEAAAASSHSTGIIEPGIDVGKRAFIERDMSSPGWRCWRRAS
jgi:hypothetical protein